jgi:hypothetical protein
MHLPQKVKHAHVFLIDFKVQRAAIERYGFVAVDVHQRAILGRIADAIRPSLLSQLVEHGKQRFATVALNQAGTQSRAPNLGWASVRLHIAPHVCYLRFGDSRFVASQDFRGLG